MAVPDLNLSEDLSNVQVKFGRIGIITLESYVSYWGEYFGSKIMAQELLSARH